MALDKNFDAKNAEHKLYEAWENGGAFKAGQKDGREGAEPFTIMIPPPNVTGSLHMGHAFNNTLQDILTRWHRMRGFDTLWQPGMDHAGIATQMVVERQLGEQGKRRTDYTREEFTDLIWKWKEESGGTIKGQLKRLGASCDWEREAFTMSGNFPDAVLKTFVEFYNKGLIFKGKRLVNWDPHFETAISDLEVENIETPGHMWHFKYPLAGGATYKYLEKDEDGNVVLEEERDYISIATTRPETMLGDGAVAVHPDDARYAPIVGQLCEIPVGPKEHRRLIPIITDEYPDMNFGSGAVKITGAHDFNDYEVAKRGGIPMYSLMDGKGAMRSDGKPYAEEAGVAQAIANGEQTFDENMIAAMNLVPEEYRGLDRFEARTRVVADITAEGLAVMVFNPDYDPEGEMDEEIPLVENKPIMQPFGDRSKVVIEPMLTDQWFVDTAKVVEPALEAVRKGETQILPEQHKKVYFNWLENIEPWCISRQLWWGHQVPVWYGTLPAWPDSVTQVEGVSYQLGDSQVTICAVSEEAALEKAKQFYGSEAKISEDVLSASKAVDADGGNYIYRDPDVLDTWFSSGLWPLGTLGWPDQTEALEKYYPTSVLITGFDIIFFWVARMMMMQLEMDGRAPFHTVYVHALVRDEKGKKMSKSLGNVLDPLELIDLYGADAVRFTLTAMAAMGRDLKLSTQRIEGYRNFTTKLWNAAKFAEMNEAYSSGSELPKATQTANKWIIGETARARVALDEALTNYRFNDAATVLYSHIRGTFCDWYVEFAKPLFGSQDDAVIAETRATMAWALDQCLLLAHPVIPFITEELWAEMRPRDGMLVRADWPEYGLELADAEADAEMAWVIGLIESIRSVRSEMNVNAGAKLPLIQLDLDGAGKAALERNASLIARMARVTEFEVAEAAPKGGVTIPVKGGTFCLPLEGIVDFAAEAARVSKGLGKLEKEIGGLKGKLGNQKFLANAPEEVVREQQARLDAAQEEAGKLKAAVARMEAMG